jgi:hypothetical protein
MGAWRTRDGKIFATRQRAGKIKDEQSDSVDDRQLTPLGADG